MSNISRKDSFGGDVLFVDGLPGCGKTLISRLLATLERVELLSYSYEIEHYCALAHLGKIDPDAAAALIKIQSDLKIYNAMMGRDVNCRPSDLSSIFNHHDPMFYLKRFFESGDEVVPDRVSVERPILNLAVHNLLAFSKTLWEALGSRCIFIEVVRHPLYMVRQQVLNFENLIGDKRDFTVYFSHNGIELPYYVKGWEDEYLQLTPMEKVIRNIQNITSMTNIFKQEMRSSYHCKILTIPFESFVLDPLPWLEKISNLIGAQFTKATRKVLDEQNVPREKIADGVDLDIYRRCGWTPPVGDASERDELMIRRQDVVRNVSCEILSILDVLSHEYEKTYWNPDAATRKD